VPYTTLCDRINGRPGRREGHQAQQLLSDAEETTLCDWIEYYALVAKPLDIQGILNLAAEISGKQPGKNWIDRFKTRHPKLCYSKPGGLDPKRAQNFNPTNVAGFYDLLKAIYDVYPNLPPEHIWNMDEKGLQLGGSRKRSRKYFHFESLKRSNFFQVRSDSLELVTIIECISPAGLSVPPAFILPQGPIPALSDLADTIGAVATSPNGWTDNVLGLEWFKQAFIPFATAHRVNDNPILLLLDGHDSHETDELRTVAYEHRIFILAFPSKCTHKLQPLDVTVFAQVQHKWSAHCDKRAYEYVYMNRHNVIPEYMKVRAACMTPELMRSAFSSTGIYPFNPDIFTDEDFAPAKTFSTIPHVPSSFPADIPSSSPDPSNASDSAPSGEGEDEAQSDPPEVEADVGSHPLYMDWDSDDDGPDYEPPLSIVSASPPSRALPLSSTPTSHISLPSLITSLMPPTSTPTAAAESSIPVHSAEPSEPPVSVPDDSNSTYSRPFTRSQNASSSAVSISIALDPTRAPMPTSHEEKDTEIARLRIANAFMSKALAQKDQELLRSQAVVAASNAHCTIIKRAESSAREELQNRKNKTRRTVKTSARYVAHDTMKELHASQTQERLRREKETAEKEARKVKEGIARDARIQEEIKTRIFSGAWPLYLHSFT
jgi:DDE superfamily endonuclease